AAANYLAAKFDTGGIGSCFSSLTYGHYRGASATWPRIMLANGASRVPGERVTAPWTTQSSSTISACAVTVSDEGSIAVLTRENSCVLASLAAWVEELPRGLDGW